jgi:nifR3 family TIM-barrel protein
LAGYTNLAFRLAVRELGGLGLATTDLVNARALLRGGRKTEELTQSCATDRPLAVQIYGQEPSELCAAAQKLENDGVSVVDINMGCPVHKVVRGGGGAAMMCQPHKTVDLVRRVVESVRIPITVKMRLGWDDSHWSAPFFAREFEQAGVAGVIIHGRTRSQGFGGQVSLQGIRAVVEAVARIPVIGNGDIRNPTDAIRMRLHTGCAGVAIGRGALLNPWIFAQLAGHGKSPTVPHPAYTDRLDFLERHFRLLVSFRGDRFGCLTFRKVANWYCRVLRPGRNIQQALVRLESVAAFETLMARMRKRGEPLDSSHSQAPEPEIVPTPQGPVERW